MSEEKEKLDLPSGTFEERSAIIELMRSRVDPKGQIPWSMIAACVMCGNSSEEDEHLLGKMLSALLRDGTAENLKLFCDNVQRLRKTFDDLPRRHAWAWRAVIDYKEAHGDFPQGPKELRKFMEDKPHVYRETPSPNGPWTRLWDESGIREFLSSLNQDPPKTV